MNDKILTSMLSALNQQLLNCVQRGAKFNHEHRYDCVSGGDTQQNIYYQGHFNLAEQIAMSIDPANYIDVDKRGMHRVKRCN